MPQGRLQVTLLLSGSERKLNMAAEDAEQLASDIRHHATNGIPAEGTYTVGGAGESDPMEELTLNLGRVAGVIILRRARAFRVS